MADDDYRRWAGFRDDVDLSQRWWHRLFKVVYGVLLLVVFGLIYAMRGEVLPDRELKNVEVNASLGEWLGEAGTGVPNILPAFQAKAKYVGVLNKDTDAISYASSYELGRSWCTADARKYFKETAKFLADRSFQDVTFDSDLQLSRSIDKAVGENAPARLCWMYGDLQKADLSDIIAYDFTWRATAYAWGKLGFWFFVANLVLQNIYYRGLVYIIVGPRKPVAAQAAVIKQDTDYEETL